MKTQNVESFLDLLKIADQKWNEIEPAIRASLKGACSRSAEVEVPGIVLVSARVLADHTRDVSRKVRDHIAAMKSDSRGADVINRGFGAFRSDADDVALKTVIYPHEAAPPRTYVMTREEAAIDKVEMWIELAL